MENPQSQRTLCKRAFVSPAHEGGEWVRKGDAPAEPVSVHTGEPGCWHGSQLSETYSLHKQLSRTLHSRQALAGVHIIPQEPYWV